MWCWLLSCTVHACFRCTRAELKENVSLFSFNFSPFTLLTIFSFHSFISKQSLSLLLPAKTIIIFISQKFWFHHHTLSFEGKQFRVPFSIYPVPFSWKFSFLVKDLFDSFRYIGGIDLMFSTIIQRLIWFQ